MQQKKEMKDETWRGWSTWERRSEEWWGKRVRSAESAVSVCFGGILLINPIAASISLSLSLSLLLFSVFVCVCVSVTLFLCMNECMYSFLPSFVKTQMKVHFVCLIRVSLAGTHCPATPTSTACFQIITLTLSILLFLISYLILSSKKFTSKT